MAQNNKTLLPAFAPKTKLEASHSLVGNHMRSHYRRVSTARAGTDSGPPVSLIKSLKGTHRVQVNWNQPSGYDAKTKKKPPIGYLTNSMTDEGLKQSDNGTSPSHSGRSPSHSGDSPSHTGDGALTNAAEKWRRYATKTGQLTGYVNMMRKERSLANESRQGDIWKPAFSVNSTSTIHSHYPSLAESSSPQKKKISNTYSLTPNTTQDIKPVTEQSFSTEPDYAAHMSLTPEDDSVVQENTHTTLQGTEELEYLNFMVGITQDILARQLVSDAALKLLISAHVEHHKLRLDKDKMMRKVSELKEQLGIG